MNALEFDVEVTGPKTCKILVSLDMFSFLRESESNILLDHVFHMQVSWYLLSFRDCTSIRERDIRHARKIGIGFRLEDVSFRARFCTGTVHLMKNVGAFLTRTMLTLLATPNGQHELQWSLWI